MQHNLSKQLLFQATSEFQKTVTLPCIGYEANGDVYLFSEVLTSGGSIPEITGSNSFTRIKPETLKVSYDGGDTWIKMN